MDKQQYKRFLENALNFHKVEKDKIAIKKCEDDLKRLKS
jgi:hypothetical protein